MAKLNDKCIFISATEKDNFPELKKLLYNEIREIHTERFPYNDFLYQEYE
jgi:GTP-binding protein HflX